MGRKKKRKKKKMMKNQRKSADNYEEYHETRYSLAPDSHEGLEDAIHQELMGWNEEDLYTYAADFEILREEFEEKTDLVAEMVAAIMKNDGIKKDWADTLKYRSSEELYGNR